MRKYESNGSELVEVKRACGVGCGILADSQKRLKLKMGAGTKAVDKACFRCSLQRNMMELIKFVL